MEDVMNMLGYNVKVYECGFSLIEGFVTQSDVKYKQPALS
jgi:hypothetical protein